MLDKIEKVLAPAKLNLFLHIVGKRRDGYHLLQSVFTFIDWYDHLDFYLTRDGSISRVDTTTPLPPQDLCLKVAGYLQRTYRVSTGVKIVLTKNIPAQAGLGGGSSDAAACLLALRRLWQLPIEDSELNALGVQFGADVPFFLQHYGCWVEGIGEKLTPLKLPEGKFLVIKPSLGCSTAEIFRRLPPATYSKEQQITAFLAAPFDFGHNDLEKAALAINPQLATLMNDLRHLGLAPRMTGSGSAVFAVLDNPKKITAAKNFLAKTKLHGKICNNLAFHDLSNLC